MGQQARVMSSSAILSDINGKNGENGENGERYIGNSSSNGHNKGDADMDRDDELYLSNDEENGIERNNENDVATKINIDGKVVDISYKDLITALKQKHNDDTTIIAGENINVENESD